MDNSFFSLEEAAGILECSVKTVRRLLDEEWLTKPVGRPSKGQAALIMKKSLFQFMIIDHVSHFPKKTLREFVRGRKNFGKMLGQIEEPRRFSMVEGGGQNAAVKGSLDSPPNNEPKRCVNHAFAAEHQFSFGWCAGQLAPGDPALQDDLVQEMSLAVLEYEKVASFEYLFELARNRAIDFLRYEERRGMMPLSEARWINDSFMEKMASLKLLIEKLTRRGVPAEWIEELLGEEQDVA